MSAQDLPYDIIYIIVSHLAALLPREPGSHSPRLAPYTAISKPWNLAIEQHTFSHLELRADRLSHASELLTKDPLRRTALRRVEFVGWYHKSASLRRELSETQLWERDQAFSMDMQRLFTLLAGVERDARQAGLMLELTVALQEVLPEGWAGDEEEDEGEDSDDDFDYGPHDFERPKYDPAFLRYTGESLPRVNCVRWFKVPYANSRTIWGASIATVMAAMDGLERCDLSLCDEQTVDARVRTDYRKGTCVPCSASGRLTLVGA